MWTVSPSGRNASLDALRVFSLLGIVTLHVAVDGFRDNRPLGFVLDELSRFAVPAFFILSAWFWKPEELADPFRLLARVVRRIGMPFAVWVLASIVWNAAFRPHETLDLSPGGVAFITWTGGAAFHLWFLPALIVGTAIVSVAGHYLGWRVTLVLALVLYATGMVLGSYARALTDLGLPLWLDRNGLFFAPVFLVVGVLLRRNRDRVAGLPLWAIAVAALGFGALQLAEGYFVLSTYPTGHDYSVSTLGYGIAVVMLFMRIELRSPLWFLLGRATFTAYLAHVLVIAAFVDGLQLGTHSLLVIALTFVTSLALGLAWRWLRPGLVWRRTTEAG